MHKRDKIIAVSFLTSPEVELWGDKLRHIFVIDDETDFADLLKAIDQSDPIRGSHGFARGA